MLCILLLHSKQICLIGSSVYTFPKVHAIYKEMPWEKTHISICYSIDPVYVTDGLVPPMKQISSRRQHRGRMNDSVAIRVQ